MYQDLAITENYGSGGGSGSGGLSGTVKIGSKVMTAQAFADLMADIHSATYQWALKDIATFRAIGIHRGDMPGSVLDWRTVDWNAFGASNSNLSDHQVLWNFMNWAMGF